MNESTCLIIANASANLPTVVCNGKQDNQIVTAANEVWGKVIFLHLFVILFTGGEVCSRGGSGPGGGCACSRGVCSGGCLLPRGVSASQGGCAWWRPPQMATAVGSMHPTGMHSCYRPQQSWAKVIFSQACVKNSVHRGGGCLPQCMLGYIPPTGPGTPPRPGTPLSRHPPRPGTPPPWGRHPPGADTPPGKHTAAYGQRAAGTHPTRMHSCFK